MFKKKSRYPSEFNKMRELKFKEHSYCEQCESKNDLQVHHIDKNKNNNNKCNLIVLCFDCHKKYHPNININKKYSRNPKGGVTKACNRKDTVEKFMFPLYLNKEEKDVLKELQVITGIKSMGKMIKLLIRINFILTDYHRKNYEKDKRKPISLYLDKGDKVYLNSLKERFCVNTIGSAVRRLLITME